MSLNRLNMYILKYIPEQVYRNSKDAASLEEFIAENPDFPIVKGEYFEYRVGGFDRINSEGHHIARDVAEFQTLIQAIEALDD